MSQFDETTKARAAEHSLGRVPIPALDFTAGRNSAKDSLEILARAVKNIESVAVIGSTSKVFRDIAKHCREATASTRARGDWPLEEA